MSSANNPNNQPSPQQPGETAVTAAERIVTQARELRERAHLPPLPAEAPDHLNSRLLLMLATTAREMGGGTASMMLRLYSRKLASEDSSELRAQLELIHARLTYVLAGTNK